MRVLSFSLVVLLLSFSCHAQNKEIKGLAVTLKQGRFSNDQALLRKAFKASHRLYLQHYKAYSETNDIFKTGNFDCLSGTLFFSELLDELGFDYKVYETNYHIFLIARTTKGDVLVETTDRNSGFVTGKNEIKDRLFNYKNYTSPSMYLSNISIFNEVNHKQMEGLILFNKSVSNFLRGDFNSCYSYLKKAKEVYDTPRISSFGKVLIQQIVVSELAQEVKEELIYKIKSLVEERVSLASR